MTCDLCGQREANVHLTEVVNNQTRELHLCEQCAQERGAEAAEHFGLADLLAGLADFGIHPEGRAAAGRATCSRCGMTFDDFRKIGRLGCGDCYASFQKFLAPLLRKVHGSTRHVGQMPPLARGAKAESADELGPLKERLKAAVAAEAFEEAARLRDRIRALEGRTNGVKGKSEKEKGKSTR